MKKTNFSLFTAILIIMTITGGLFAGAGLIAPGPTASSIDGNVVIEWRTQNEVNVDYFAIERKTPNMTFPVTLPDKIYPNSDHYYRFVDKSAYKTNDNVYTYRIAIVDKDGTISHSGEFYVNHSSVSGVKRTWGSIKAMFR